MKIPMKQLSRIDAARSFTLLTSRSTRSFSAKNIPCRCLINQSSIANNINRRSWRYLAASSKYTWSPLSLSTQNPNHVKITSPSWGHERPFFLWSSSKKDDDDRDNDDDDDDDDRRDKQGNGGFGGGGLGGGIASFLLLSLGVAAFAILDSQPEARSKQQEINLTKFLHGLLPTGEVDYLTVNISTLAEEEGEPSSSAYHHVDVHMRKGSVVDGEPITSSKPFRYFKVRGSLRSFESKLREAQNELGVHSKDHIPVWFVRRDVQKIGDVINVVIFLGLGAGIWYLTKGRMSAQGSQNAMRGMNPFSGMTRAKTTIVNPGAKKGVVKVWTFYS